MSKDAVVAFRNKLVGSDDLQAKVREAVSAGGSLGQVLRELGSAEGFDFSLAEARDAWHEGDDIELAEFELEMVSGGSGWEGIWGEEGEGSS